MPLPSENKIFINSDGYIEVSLIGEQTEGTFQDVYDQAVPLIKKQRFDGKPVLGLFDLTFQTGFSLKSDKAAMQMLEEIDYDRIAMYNVPHAEVTKGIIYATGKSENTRLFSSREEAVAWLSSPIPGRGPTTNHVD